MIKIYSKDSNNKLDNLYVKCANYEIIQTSLQSLYSDPREAGFNIFDIATGTPLSRPAVDKTTQVINVGSSTKVYVEVILYETIVGNIKMIGQIKCNGTIRELDQEFGSGAAGQPIKRCPLVYTRRDYTLADLNTNKWYKVLGLAGVSALFTYDGDGVYLTFDSDTVSLTVDYTYYNIDCDILYNVTSDMGSGSEADVALTRANYAVNKANQADEKASRLEKIDVNGLISI